VRIVRNFKGKARETAQPADTAEATKKGAPRREKIKEKKERIMGKKRPPSSDEEEEEEEEEDEEELNLEAFEESEEEEYDSDVRIS
jgi:hypothetical protein